jgi:protein transport protein SEC24
MILRHPKLQPANAANPPKQGTERIDLWQSSNNFFKNTGTELAHGQISFDLFDFTFGQKKMYKNVKTFSDISAHSSGNMYYYPEFSARTHGLKFTNELYHNLTRKLAWEAVFRIRLSHGFT